MITLVMGPQQQAGGDSLAVQVSPTVPAGDVTLRATATLLRPPGQEAAVWTVDGERAGTSTWTLVRRLADGRSVWQTGITVALAEGPHVVTVALRSLVDGASVTAIPIGGGEVSNEIKLSIVYSGITEWLPGIRDGDAQSAGDDPITVSGAGLKYVMAAIYYKTFDAGNFPTAAWYVSSTAAPTTEQFGSLYVGSSIIFRLEDCPAGVYSIYATLNIQGVTEPTNTVTMTVT